MTSAAERMAATRARRAKGISVAMVHVHKNDLQHHRWIAEAVGLKFGKKMTPDEIQLFVQTVFNLAMASARRDFDRQNFEVTTMLDPAA